MFCLCARRRETRCPLYSVGYTFFSDCLESGIVREPSKMRFQRYQSQGGTTRWGSGNRETMRKPGHIGHPGDVTWSFQHNQSTTKPFGHVRSGWHDAAYVVERPWVGAPSVGTERSKGAHLRMCRQALEGVVAFTVHCQCLVCTCTCVCSVCCSTIYFYLLCYLLTTYMRA